MPTNKPTNMVFMTILLMAGMALSACNTVEGFGKDLSKLGDKIADKADKHTK